MDSLRAQRSSALPARNKSHTKSGATNNKPTPQSKRLIASANGVTARMHSVTPAIRATAWRDLLIRLPGIASSGDYLPIDTRQRLGEMLRLVHHGVTATAKQVRYIILGILIDGNAIDF